MTQNGRFTDTLKEIEDRLGACHSDAVGLGPAAGRKGRRYYRLVTALSELRDEARRLRRQYDDRSAGEIVASDPSVRAADRRRRKHLDDLAQESQKAGLE